MSIDHFIQSLEDLFPEVYKIEVEYKYRRVNNKAERIFSVIVSRSINHHFQIDDKPEAVLEFLKNNKNRIMR